MEDSPEGAVGLLKETWTKLNADPVPLEKDIWRLRWKLLLILTDTVLGVFPEAVLGVAGVACAAAGAIYLGQKWGWALNASSASNTSNASSSTDALASATGTSKDPKKSDIHWVVLYAMYALGVVLILGFFYLFFTLPENEKNLTKRFQQKGKWLSIVPVYALLIVGASIAGVLSSILAESTLRIGDPEGFQMKETEVPSTNRRLLFLHGIAGLAVAFAILLVIYPKAWVGKYQDTGAFRPKLALSAQPKAMNSHLPSSSSLPS